MGTLIGMPPRCSLTLCLDARFQFLVTFEVISLHATVQPLNVDNFNAFRQRCELILELEACVICSAMSNARGRGIPDELFQRRCSLFQFFVIQLAVRTAVEV